MRTVSMSVYLNSYQIKIYFEIQYNNTWSLTGWLWSGKYSLSYFTDKQVSRKNYHVITMQKQATYGKR